MYYLKKVTLFILLFGFITSCSDEDETIDIKIPTQSESINDFITDIKSDLISDDSDHLSSIRNIYGEISWHSSQIRSSDEDDSQLAIVPLIDTKKEETSALMFAYRESPTSNLRYHFIKKDGLESLSSKGASELPYSDALLYFISSDQRVFEKTSCDLIEKAKRTFGDKFLDDNQKTAICYAIVDIYQNNWFQYNPATGVWDYLDSSTSSQYVGSVCIDINSDGLPDGNPNGGNTGGSGHTGNAWDNGVVEGKLCANSINIKSIGDASYAGIYDLTIAFHNKNINRTRFVTLPQICMRSTTMSAAAITAAFSEAVWLTEIELGALPRTSFPQEAIIREMLKANLIIASKQFLNLYSDVYFSLQTCAGVPTRKGTWGKNC